jgi:hypothetical protein
MVFTKYLLPVLAAASAALGMSFGLYPVFILVDFAFHSLKSFYEELQRLIERYSSV